MSPRGFGARVLFFLYLASLIARRFCGELTGALADPADRVCFRAAIETGRAVAPPSAFVIACTVDWRFGKRSDLTRSARQTAPIS